MAHARASFNTLLSQHISQMSACSHVVYNEESQTQREVSQTNICGASGKKWQAPRTAGNDTRNIEIQDTRNTETSKCAAHRSKDTQIPEKINKEPQCLIFVLI